MAHTMKENSEIVGRRLNVVCTNCYQKNRLQCRNSEMFLMMEIPGFVLPNRLIDLTTVCHFSPEAVF